MYRSGSGSAASAAASMGQRPASAASPIAARASASSGASVESTNLAPFHTLFAKLRAPSMRSCESGTSWQGVTPVTSA